jgi:hypothetical protein
MTGCFDGTNEGKKVSTFLKKSFRDGKGIDIGIK